jgi:hypothetical protein
MTNKHLKHLRDLNFLSNFDGPLDMSPQDITERMNNLNELCELSRKLGIPDIYYYRDQVYIDPPTIDARAKNN